MKKRSLRILFAVALLSLGFTSCEVLNQIAGMANLVNCKYALNNVTDVCVAGVSVKNVSNGNITASDLLKLTAALSQKKVPITMNVNVDVTNPTANSASLTAMDWVCEIDGLQLATGTSTRAYTITPNATTKVSLPVAADAYSLFSSLEQDALKNFISSFKSNGTNDKLAIAIRPSVKVGEVSIPSPGYINIVGKCKTINSDNASSSSSSSTGNTQQQGGTQHATGTANVPNGKK